MNQLKGKKFPNRLLTTATTVLKALDGRLYANGEYLTGQKALDYLTSMPKTDFDSLVLDVVHCQMHERKPLNPDFD